MMILGISELGIWWIGVWGGREREIRWIGGERGGSDQRRSNFFGGKLQAVEGRKPTPTSSGLIERLAFFHGLSTEKAKRKKKKRKKWTRRSHLIATLVISTGSLCKNRASRFGSNSNLGVMSKNMATFSPKIPQNSSLLTSSNLFPSKIPSPLSSLKTQSYTHQILLCKSVNLLMVAQFAIHMGSQQWNN